MGALLIAASMAAAELLLPMPISPKANKLEPAAISPSANSLPSVNARSACAKVIAGYSLGGADMLRRAMGKKDQAAMDQQRQIFIKGAKEKHNIAESKANEIFDLLNKFAQYGFNKSHSAAYAVVAYQTAYLKANYPLESMAAFLTAELGNAEKVSHFIDEALAMGIDVQGPDVNESRENFAPVAGGRSVSDWPASRVWGKPPRSRSSRNARPTAPSSISTISPPASTARPPTSASSNIS